jgi:hypothetical protein
MKAPMSGMLGYIYTSLSSKIQMNRIRFFNNLALSPYFLSVKELDKAWYLDICIQHLNMSCSNIDNVEIPSIHMVFSIIFKDASNFLLPGKQEMPVSSRL